MKTASGAIAVQIVYSSWRGSRSIEHLGSAHDEGELEALKAAARQRLVAGPGELDLGLAAGASSGGPLEIASSRMGHLWDALCGAYDVLGFGQAARGDEVFRQLVLARIIEPDEHRNLNSTRAKNFHAGQYLASDHATYPPASTTMESSGRRSRANGQAYGGATRYPLQRLLARDRSTIR